MTEDRRFDAAATDFHRVQERFIGELLLHISNLVREDYPSATTIVTHGQFDDGELKVRIQQVRAGAEVVFDVEVDGEFGNLDDIDGKLCWLGLLSGEDYLGEQETDLWSDHDLPPPAGHDGSHGAGAAVGGIAGLFTPDEIEALVRTAADAVHGQLDDLSARQRELAKRAWRALHDDTAGSTP